MERQGFEDLSDATFRRLTGIRKRTVLERGSVLQYAEAHRKARGGKPNHRAISVRLLMRLASWREYRTSLPSGHRYGVSARTADRTIRWCEDTLITSRAVTLPGKKALGRSDRPYEAVRIDATETPVERPHKNSAATMPARKTVTP